eukprot:COSAG05_NODE_1546_length_4588_cov_3.851637_3_plen_78_part_00
MTIYLPLEASCRNAIVRHSKTAAAVHQLTDARPDHSAAAAAATAASTMDIYYHGTTKMLRNQEHRHALIFEPFLTEA